MYMCTMHTIMEFTPDQNVQIDYYLVENTKGNICIYVFDNIHVLRAQSSTWT